MVGRPAEGREHEQVADEPGDDPQHQELVAEAGRDDGDRGHGIEREERHGEAAFAVAEAEPQAFAIAAAIGLK